MKRSLVTWTILLTAIAGLASAPTADALEWEVRAFHATAVIDLPEPLEPKLVANGLHQTVITEVSVIDIIPVRIRVDKGSLLRDGLVSSSCKTGWTWSFDETLTTCATSQVIIPCEDGWWQARTVGTLQLNPKGGTKQTVSDATFLDCDCV